MPKEHSSRHHHKHRSDPLSSSSREEDLERRLEGLNEQLEKKKRELGVSEFISVDDFYRKNNEFRVWLLSSRKKYMDDLSSKKVKHYFKKFVKRWNRGKLDPKLYEGVHSTDLSSRERTKYSWNLKNVDSFELDLMRDSVDTMTYAKSWEDGRVKMLQKQKQKEEASDTMPLYEVEDEDTIRNRRSTADQILEQENQRKRSRHEDKMYAKRRKEDLDELVPKPDPGSYAARREKSKQINAKLHGSRDDVDFSIDPYEDDNTSSDFRRQLSRERMQRDKKQAEVDAKLKAYEESERQKVAQFRPANHHFQNK